MVTNEAKEHQGRLVTAEQFGGHIVADVVHPSFSIHLGDEEGKSVILWPECRLWCIFVMSIGRGTAVSVVTKNNQGHNKKSQFISLFHRQFCVMRISYERIIVYMKTF